MAGQLRAPMSGSSGVEAFLHAGQKRLQPGAGFFFELVFGQAFA